MTDLRAVFRMLECGGPSGVCGCEHPVHHDYVVEIACARCRCVCADPAENRPAVCPCCAQPWLAAWP